MKLIRDRWVCMVACDNPRVADLVTTADLSGMPWVASFGRSIFSTSPPVRQLRSLGIEPNIEITVDSFQAVSFLLADRQRRTRPSRHATVCAMVGEMASRPSSA
jgi:hypothetical protein